jgi:hypothetical protein
MAAKAKRKEISFDRAGMLNFRSINEALKYFSEPKNGKYSRKSITWLFGETYELNVGSLSMNMAAYLESPKVFESLLKGPLKNPNLAEKVKMEIEKWVKENNGKDISSPIKDLKNIELEQKEAAIEADLSNENL